MYSRLQAQYGNSTGFMNELQVDHGMGICYNEKHALYGAQRRNKVCSFVLSFTAALFLVSQNTNGSPSGGNDGRHVMDCIPKSLLDVTREEHRAGGYKFA